MARPLAWGGARARAGGGAAARPRAAARGPRAPFRLAAAARLLAERGGPAAIHLAESPDEARSSPRGREPGRVPGLARAGARGFLPAGQTPSVCATASACSTRVSSRPMASRRGPRPRRCSRAAASTSSSARAATRPSAWPGATPALLASGVKLRWAATAWPARRPSTSSTTRFCCASSSPSSSRRRSCAWRRSTAPGAGLPDLGRRPGQARGPRLRALARTPRDPEAFLVSGEARPSASRPRVTAGLDERVLVARRLRPDDQLLALGVRAALRAGLRGAGRPRGGVPRAQLAWIVVAMVGARSAAMGFNRLADHAIDARNPRTAGRELPRGISRAARCGRSWRVSAAGAGAGRGDARPAVPAAVAASRSPSSRLLVHEAFHDASHSCSACRWRSRRSAPGSRSAVSFAPSRSCSRLAVLFWVAGFDTIYACQDVDFDRERGPALAARPPGHRRALAARARVPRRPVLLPAAALPRWRRSIPCTWRASRASRRSSPRSTRWSGPTTSRG